MSDFQGNRTQVREAVLKTQRTLTDAADSVLACRGKLDDAGYDEWGELLSHIEAEIRSEVELLEKTLDLDKGGTDGDAK